MCILASVVPVRGPEAELPNKRRGKNVHSVRKYIFIFQTTFCSRHSILLNITPLRHLHCAAPHSVRHSIVITTLTADTSLCFMTL